MLCISATTIKKYMERMEKKVTPNYTKILYSKEWSYYNFFLVYFSELRAATLKNTYFFSYKKEIERKQAG